MNSTEYFNRMIDFREDTSLYLKEVLPVLDTYKGVSFTEKSKYDFTPQYFENKLIRKALELQGWIFRSIVRHDSDTKYASIPKQSTPRFRGKGYHLFRGKVHHFVKDAGFVRS